MKLTKEEKFIESLYKLAEKQLQKIYKFKRVSRDAILQEIANILLTYTIANDVMVMDRATIEKEYNKMSKLVNDIAKGEAASQEKIIEELLSTVVKETFSFYNYNKGLKDVKKIIESNFKGKHFSERVWSNEKNVANYLNKQINSFINGKISVNQIKKDIEKTFNASAYNAKRLVTTEVSRCQNEAFRKLCEETNVKKVKRNAILDSKTCDDCYPLNGKVYELKEMPQISHPMCRCFYEVYE